MEYKGRLNSKIQELEKANQLHKETTERLRVANNSLVKVTNLRRKLQLLLTEAQDQDIEYKNRRLDYISLQVTEFINKAFPYDGYEAKVLCEPKRGFTTSLQLIDGEGHNRLVHMSEGKFNQALISLGSCISITISLGAEMILLDEPIAVSDANNIVLVSQMYDELVKQGVQIILIEQRPEGYQGVENRRELRLTKDPIRKRVLPPEIVNF